GYVSQPIAITLDGGIIHTRILMFFGQGVLRCEAYLQSIVESIQSDDKGADAAFTGILRKPIGYRTANSLRAYRLGVLPITAGAS
ncbi:acyl-CoA dehydrogenase, partial [Pseudoalteromonas sp. S186]